MGQPDIDGGGPKKKRRKKGQGQKAELLQLMNAGGGDIFEGGFISQLGDVMPTSKKPEKTEVHNCWSVL